MTVGGETGRTSQIATQNEKSLLIRGIFSCLFFRWVFNVKYERQTDLVGGKEDRYWNQTKIKTWIDIKRLDLNIIKLISSLLISLFSLYLSLYIAVGINLPFILLISIYSRSDNH